MTSRVSKLVISIGWNGTMRRDVLGRIDKINHKVVCAEGDIKINVEF